MRVVVYNVRGFRDGPGRVAALLGSLEPDLLLLNETGGRRALRRVSRVLGMEVAADPWSPLRRRVKNAVLARPPWRLVSHRLHRFVRSQPLYPRGALIARVGRSGTRLWAVSIHLGLHPGERRRHAEELADMARGLGGPVVIGGDLNDTPDGRAPRHLAERFWDAWVTAASATASASDPGSGATFPATDPTARIDYLFVSEGPVVVRAAVVQGELAAASSDHRPLMVELALEGTGSG